MKYKIDEHFYFLLFLGIYHLFFVFIWCKECEAEAPPVILNFWWSTGENMNACVPRDILVFYSQFVFVEKVLFRHTSWIDVLMQSWEVELCMRVFPISILTVINGKCGDCECGKPGCPHGCLARQAVAKLSALILRWALVKRLLFAFLVVSWWDLTHKIFAVMGRVATTS